MLSVDQYMNICLTRGDTARLTISIVNDNTDGEYEIQPDDVLVMTVKRKTTDHDICFQKIVNGDSLIHIKPEDTSELDFGKYKYDVELRTASGDVYTVIEPSTFCLLQEVTY